MDRTEAPGIAALSASPAVDRAVLRVFVVEDHKDTRWAYSMMFEEMGHEVVFAASLAEALQKIPTSNCDVLISDIGLPDGTGWDLLERVELPAGVCTIAISGFGTEADWIRSKSVGFHHHLIKPMGFDQLEHILDALAAKRAEVDAP
jgi:DNA-binding NtrC family response regulator